MANLRKEQRVNLGVLLVLVLVPVLAYALDEMYYVNLASRVVLVAMAGVGLNLALGYGGLISFGHAAFFGLGGYVAGIAAHHSLEETLFAGLIPGTDRMLIIWSVAVLCAGALAWAIGIISLRAKGVHFIMITLACAQMIYYLTISVPTYGAQDGLSIYIRNGIEGLNTDNELIFFALCFAALICSVLFVSRIMTSRFGAALTMAKLNETRLETAGIAPKAIRLVAFVLSAMITGWAGALFADLNGFVGPSMLNWHRSGEIMVIVILGGVGRLYGPIVGAIVFVLLESFIGAFTERWQFFLGLIMLSVVLYAPGGLMGLIAGKQQHD